MHAALYTYFVKNYVNHHVYHNVIDLATPVRRNKLSSSMLNSLRLPGVFGSDPCVSARTAVNFPI